MKTSLRYRMQKAFLKWFGNIEIHWQPFWIIFGSTKYQVKGPEMRHILNVLKPGDILLRRYSKHLSSRMIPGWYTHAAIYIGDDKVIHALGEGVIEEDILTFMHCDGIAVLEGFRSFNNWYDEEVAWTISKAVEALGSEYDWVFDDEDSSRFSCTELVVHCICYTGFEPFKRESGLGKGHYVPDDFLVYNLHVKYDSKWGWCGRTE